MGGTAPPWSIAKRQAGRWESRHPPFSGEKGTRRSSVRQRTGKHMVGKKKKKAWLALPPGGGRLQHATPQQPSPRSRCQGFPASKGTRELLPRRIVHSPFQNTACRHLRGPWRATSHRVRNPAGHDLCLFTYVLLQLRPQVAYASLGHQECQAPLQPLKATAQSVPRSTRNTGER